MSELYELPDGWEWKIIDEVCQKITDGAHKSPKTIEDGKPYITVRDVDSKGKIDFINCKKISQIDYDLLVKGNCKPLKGDVLFSKDGTVGKVSLIDYEKDFVVLSSLAILRPSLAIQSEYLAQYLNSPFFYDKAIKSKTGAAIKRVVLRTIKNLDIPLPPLPEQQRIVSKLDLLFEKIDKSIALHQKNMDEADVFMGSVLNDVFGELEERYQFYKIYDKFDLKTGGTPSTKNKEYWENGTIKWLSSKDINQIEIFDCEGRITEEGYNSSNTKFIEKNSVLIALNGQGKTRGSVAMLRTEATLNQSLVAIIPKNRNENMSEFLFRNLQMRYIEIRKMTGLNERRGLNMKLIGNIELPLPPLSVQQKAVKYLEEISEKTEKVKSIQKEKMDSLKALKASVLDKAFKGEL